MKKINERTEKPKNRKTKRQIFYFQCLILCLLSLVFDFWSCNEVMANNVAVTNISMTSQSTSAQTVVVEFDISWENSWKNGICYDAAWVFVKYSTDAGATWAHASLKTNGTNPSGFSQGTGTGLNIVVPADKKGAFLERSANNNAMEPVDTDNIQFVWNWGSDKLSNDPVTAITASTTARLKVFAIEMVYIPQGAFYAGDGGSSYDFQQGAADTDPWYVNDSDGMVTNGGEFYYTSALNTGEDATGTAFTIPAAFPNGFDAFYLMKYEVSQGQYRDFLNTLTRAQQNTRTETNVSTDAITNIYVMSNTAAISNRQVIRCPASGNGTTAPITFSCNYDGGGALDGTFDEADDGEWLACNYVKWLDLCAYADWAGLRPMTELEFEKACRGPNTHITGEYAWGTTGIAASAYTLGNTGTAGEGISANYSTTLGNCSYTTTDGTIDGPLRVGIFSANAGNTGRVTAGAGYYGNMELSGNLWERTVTVGNATGRSFTGTSGNGALDAAGNADTANWPGTDAIGSGLRGGDWVSSTTSSRVSDRTNAATVSTARSNNNGGRAARTP